MISLQYAAADFSDGTVSWWRRYRTRRVDRFKSPVSGMLATLTFSWTGQTVPDRKPIPALRHGLDKARIARLLAQCTPQLRDRICHDLVAYESTAPNDPQDVCFRKNLARVSCKLN